MIIVDTDILIEILDKGSRLGAEALNKITDSNEPFSITSITLHELLYGQIKKSKDMADALKLPVLSYTKEDARLSASLEANAESKGRQVSRMDSMIAAIAISYGAKLYTNNVKDFENFDDLELFG